MLRNEKETGFLCVKINGGIYEEASNECCVQTASFGAEKCGK